MPAAAGCQHAGRRERRFFLTRLKKMRRPVGFGSPAASRQARRVGAGLITRRDLKGAAAST